ncbi:hypothetical protein G6F24_016877 [Rhizopus arrhizus]|nr:hypothetical protein G6F24_016877 [Rhizopus arrhizus]
MGPRAVRSRATRWALSRSPGRSRATVAVASSTAKPTPSAGALSGSNVSGSALALPPITGTRSAGATPSGTAALADEAASNTKARARPRMDHRPTGTVTDWPLTVIESTSARWPGWVS